MNDAPTKEEPASDDAVTVGWPQCQVCKVRPLVCPSCHASPDAALPVQASPPDDAVQEAIASLEWHYANPHPKDLAGLRQKLDAKACRALKTLVADHRSRAATPTPAKAVDYSEDARWLCELAENSRYLQPDSRERLDRIATALNARAESRAAEQALSPDDAVQLPPLPPRLAQTLGEGQTEWSLAIDEARRAAFIAGRQSRPEAPAPTNEEIERIVAKYACDDSHRWEVERDEMLLLARELIALGKPKES